MNGTYWRRQTEIGRRLAENWANAPFIKSGSDQVYRMVMWAGDVDFHYFATSSDIAVQICYREDQIAKLEPFARGTQQRIVFSMPSCSGFVA